jgi:hypothetical protein
MDFNRPLWVPTLERGNQATTIRLSSVGQGRSKDISCLCPWTGFSNRRLPFFPVAILVLIHILAVFISVAAAVSALGDVHVIEYHAL